ncbi:hypothetical protein ANOM_011494 [Aspergillus nomiae NRRL 13137]|uniref:Uncharacterized protein n=1 Tax=Aspergillus nomiae NRRL (strain ATCC 15546 / NRRL 13137 / CBS 260.88 / M93) TaxID=1509407 RepID=A0A0L1ILB4_ASPN3|nr:uncharacterized protein ANOM_011494 [Aspergillus nomiae NRRL 13137]KNG80369.1 hypothetical protein ANOM_011494 [Aspergillus nomiae NRRL 13137]
MKYSVLSSAALVAPALGNPAYYWRQYLSHPIYPADAGTVKIENSTPFNIQVDAEPLGDHFTIPPGQPGSVPGAFSEDVKFNEQVEVSYVSGYVYCGTTPASAGSTPAGTAPTGTSSGTPATGGDHLSALKAYVSATVIRHGFSVDFKFRPEQADQLIADIAQTIWHDLHRDLS